jgi:hypothetical protein
MKHGIYYHNLPLKVVVRDKIIILARNDFPSQTTPFHLPLRLVSRDDFKRTNDRGT